MVHTLVATKLHSLFGSATQLGLEMDGKHAHEHTHTHTGTVNQSIQKEVAGWQATE
jgi:hypothetical protein